MATIEELASLGLIALGNQLLGLIESLVHERSLLIVEVLHIRLELHELGIILCPLGRTGNNERGTGVIDKDGVDLIDDGVMMLPLDEVIHTDSHIVTEVVEAELVVGTKGNIAVISLFTGFAIGFMLIDTVDGESVEHIERSHPLGISFGEVIVDSNDMDTLACKSVEEYREGRNESLSFSGRHLRYLSLMKNDTSDKLDIVMDHVPGNLIATGYPVVLPDGIVAFDMDKILSGSSQISIEISSRNRNGLILGKSPCGRFHD